MTRGRLVALYALAVCVVVGVTLGLRSREEHAIESPIPSVENPSARGAKALFTYLEETGRAPGMLRESYASLPPDAGVLVALAPTRRLITPTEWKALTAWIEEGHTFVYAVPRRVRKQYLETALQLDWVPGPRPEPMESPGSVPQGLRDLLERHLEPADPSGVFATPWMPSHLMAGVSSLRVAADDGLETDLGRSRPLAGVEEVPFVLGLTWGKGEVVILAGSELAENRRIGLGDNLALWLNLARRGRLYFDEYPQQEDAPRATVFAAIGPLVLQLFAVAALWALARGRRLGLPRPLAPSRRRSQGEYVEQLRRLYARAGIEGELCAELYGSLRLSLFEKLGISTTLDDLEAAQRLGARSLVQPERYLSLVTRTRQAQAAGVTPEEYARLSREFALLEADLVGR